MSNSLTMVRFLHGLTGFGMAFTQGWKFSPPRGMDELPVETSYSRGFFMQADFRRRENYQ